MTIQADVQVIECVNVNYIKVLAFVELHNNYVIDIFMLRIKMWNQISSSRLLTVCEVILLSIINGRIKTVHIKFKGSEIKCVEIDRNTDIF